MVFVSGKNIIFSILFVSFLISLISDFMSSFFSSAIAFSKRRTFSAVHVQIMIRTVYDTHP